MTSNSKTRSIEELGEYWDAHSLADHWGDTRKASFIVRATRRSRVTIDPAVYGQLETLARRRGISTETLVNLWIVEHMRRERKAHHPARRRAHGQ